MGILLACWQAVAQLGARRVAIIDLGPSGQVRAAAVGIFNAVVNLTQLMIENGEPLYPVEY